MKHLAIFIVLLMLLNPLFAFDLFFTDEVDSRTFSFQTESGLKLYKDGEIEPQLEIAVLLEQEKPLYRFVSSITYDAKEERLSTGELSLSLFLGSIQLKGGLYTHPWGSATLTHSVDILNAQDLSKGILDDLEAMKRPEAMISLSLYTGSSNWEFVVKPGFLPSYLEKDGRYALLPSQFSFVTFHEMDTHSLRNLGGGARYTIHHRWVDASLLYFNGYNPQAGFDAIVFDPQTFAPTSADIVYTRYQLFGLETNMVKGPWNLALEGGFFLSEDRDGTDPGRYNSKWSYVAELSYTDAKTSAFYAVAYQGQYILDYQSNSLDVDVLASYDDTCYANTIVMAVELPMYREKVTLRLAGTYQVESKGYAILGSASYAISDYLSCFVKGIIYGSGGDNASLYKSWEENDALRIGLKAWF